MKINLKKIYTPVLLVLIFFLPGIAAITVFQNPDLLSSAKVNHGELLSPPLQLTSQDSDNKWQIMYWNPNGCDKSCLAQLDKLARLRLALGRRLYQVNITYVGTNELGALDKTQLNLFKEYDIQWLLPSDEQQSKLEALSKDSQVYIADPKGYLILAYQTDENPHNIHKDLKKLLNVKE